MINIFLIRTFQPHWSQYSGINQVIKYFDQTQFKVREEVIKRIPSSSRPIRFFIRKLNDFIRMGGPKPYGISDLYAEIKGLKAFLTNNADIIFYLDGEHSIHFLPRIISLFQGIRKKPKLIGMFHQPPDKLKTLIGPKVLGLIDHCIVLTAYQANFLSKYIPYKKISIVPHGVDTNFFLPAQKKDKNGKLICLSVGYWMRDYETVFKVAEMLSDINNIEFHIVSSAVQPPEKLPNIVIHRGITDQELLLLYQKSNILFMPLLDATANNVILEALACGLPVITTRLPGTEEYIDQNNGFLVDSKDTEQFSDIILKLSKHQKSLQIMSNAARKHALKLSWENISKQIENVLIKVAM